MRVSGKKVVIVMCAVFLGCADEGTVGDSQWRNQNEDIVEVQSGLVISTFFDDSASPLHIQVKSCTADNFGGTFTIDCQVDSGYALVGGGAAHAARLMSCARDDARSFWRARRM